MSFGDELDRFQKAALANANNFKKGVGVALFTSVILDTPVDKGRARGNWQISLNDPASGETEDSASKAMTNANTLSKYGKLDDVNYLTNNLPYIENLENGSSKQSPEGMVRKNVARIDRILEEQLRRI